jgi:hypothetical protein
MPRGHLKNVFWPNIFVGASLSRVAGFPIWSYRSCGSQILDPPQADLRFKARPRRDLELKSYF